MRIKTDGKYFSSDAGRFPFRGVTYGTFRPRADGITRFPPPAQIERDFAAIKEAGFTVVRTYTAPSDDVLALAGEFDLHLLSDVFYPDWRYLLGASRSEQRRIAREARKIVSSTTRRLAGRDEILALSLGTEVPADVLRWVGTGRIARIIAELADTVRDADPERLVTYANYPTTEYLPLETLDFLMFNVFLENRVEFRRYLTRLHHFAGDRPLVLGEIGLDADASPAGEQAQAATLDWQLETALERAVAGTCIFSWTDEWWVGEAAVEDWHFGLTRADRSPRPALEVAQRWNERTVADLDFAWPSISVVVCAHNAEETLDECLRHITSLDYPKLETIVVDDGSTDATAEIARRHDGVRVLRIEHSGLSAARNEGFRAAGGDVLAYLDADAYPVREWPYYLVLGFDGSTVGAVGGPNLVPSDDPDGAQRVGRAPGGPVHVLLADDRAEHVPGCNMAVWRKLLEEVGGFDPIYRAAGDDVDLCWRILDRGWEIAFHPGAMVWHHRRCGIRSYLRQQRGYGRAEALVEARHPDRFTPAGTARWRGHIYGSFVPRLARQRVYRGAFGSAAYQSVYRSGGHALDIAHQLGVPVAAGLLLTSVLAPWWESFAYVAGMAAVSLAVLFAADVIRASAPRGRRRGLRFRTGVAVLHLLQPFARLWGRVRYRPIATQTLEPAGRLPAPVRRIGGGTLVIPEDRPRAELVTAVLRGLRRAGLRVVPASEWADHDARLLGSFLVRGELLTSSYPLGCVQLRVRRRLSPLGTVGCAGAVALTAFFHPLSAVALLALPLVDLVRGAWRTGPLVRSTIESQASLDGVTPAPDRPGKHREEELAVALIARARDTGDADPVPWAAEGDLALMDREESSR